MENIYVEALENFHFGFILTEQELRRIIETIEEQLKKTNISEDARFSFELKYANGVVAKTENIDQIFQQENSGSSKILRVLITGEIGSENNLYEIELYFSKPESNDDSSVKYSIRGKSRDWVFVASSTIEERVKKVKRVPIAPNEENKIYTYVKLLMMPVFMLVFTVILFSNLHIPKNKSMDVIEANWKNGSLKDPVEAEILIQKSLFKDADSFNPLAALIKPLLIILLIVAFLIGAWFLVSNMYPVYNFCWGDYLSTFKRIEARRRIFIWVIIVGLIISITGSLIATYLLNLKMF